MSKQYKDSLKGLGERLKSEQPKTPIQEVRPVEAPKTPATASKKSDEVHFNFWAERALMQRVKIHAAKTGKSLKEICIEALESYLPNE